RNLSADSQTIALTPQRKCQWLLDSAKLLRITRCLRTERTVIASEIGFYVAGGTLRPDAPSYVERQADLRPYHGLKSGEFCYVLTSRQMGKSSLMNRTAVRLREDGVAVAVLDLTAIGQNLSAEQWYDGLLGQLGRKLGLEDELEEFWLDHERL